MTHEEKQRRKAEKLNVPIFEEMPEGWTISKGARTAPVGFIWINNKKSLFDKERKTALLKDAKYWNFYDSKKKYIIKDTVANAYYMGGGEWTIFYNCASRYATLKEAKKECRYIVKINKPIKLDDLEISETLEGEQNQ